MTQTLSPALAPAVQHAMVVTRIGLPHYLHVFTVESVEDARDEFGGTVADALLFVEGVCCTECATEASETRPHAAVQRSCRSCGTVGCECVVVEDDHYRDVFWCLECQPSCGCRECEG